MRHDVSGRYATVEAGEQMARTTSLVHSGPTLLCFCLAARASKGPLRMLESCSSSSGRRGCVTIVSTVREVTAEIRVDRLASLQGGPLFKMKSRNYLPLQARGHHCVRVRRMNVWVVGERVSRSWRMARSFVCLAELTDLLLVGREDGCHMCRSRQMITCKDTKHVHEEHENASTR